MRGRTARKVFLLASRDWTGHRGITLAKAARRVMKRHVSVKEAWIVFTVMWAPKRWPVLQEMFTGWLGVEHPLLDADNIREFLRK
jgi:hypothetical protein